MITLATNLINMERMQSRDVFCVAVQKSEMDKKYPHKCFKCGRELKWLELLNTTQISNIDKSEEEYGEWLRLLWCSNIIEFYCCNCFNRKVRSLWK